MAARRPVNFLDEHIASRKDLGAYLELKSAIRRDDIARTAVAIREIRGLGSFSRDDAVDTERVWEPEQVSELFERAQAARDHSRQTVEECKRARALQPSKTGLPRLAPVIPLFALNLPAEIAAVLNGH